MKFAICNETYGDWPSDRIFADIVAAGYDGVEIAPFTFDDDPLQISEKRATEIGGTARSAGLEVVGLHWLLAKQDHLHLTSIDAKQHQATIDFLLHLTRLCAAMGGIVMVLGSPKQRDVPAGATYEQAFDQAVTACRAVSEIAGPMGVTLAIEPLGEVETDFITTAAEGCRLIEAVDHPACRLHLDVKAMSAESIPIPQIIAESRAHLAHFHANDPNLRGPGFGEVRFEPIAEALGEVGYNGYVSVEVFDYTPDAPTIARESIAYLRRIWGDVKIA